MSIDIAIDLGTSKTVIFGNSRIILEEPTTVTVDTETFKPVYFGNDAKETIGRTPDTLTCIHPIEHGAIELNAVTIVYMDLTLVIDPGYTENDLPLGGGQPLQQSITTVSFFISFNHNSQGVQNFLYRLMELGLGRILRNYLCKYFINVTHFHQPFFFGDC